MDGFLPVTSLILKPDIFVYAGLTYSIEPFSSVIITDELLSLTAADSLERSFVLAFASRSSVISFAITSLDSFPLYNNLCELIST
ncbi:hypothetical protein DSECCO2_657400 [anaerobic digester metagenome]